MWLSSGETRTRSWTVSGQVPRPVKGGRHVALSLRVDDPPGHMRYILTAGLSQDHLRSIVQEQSAPGAWKVGVYDRQGRSIVATRGAEVLANATVSDP